MNRTQPRIEPAHLDPKWERLRIYSIDVVCGSGNVMNNVPKHYPKP
jgi:hypothetical protein